MPQNSAAKATVQNCISLSRLALLGLFAPGYPTFPPFVAILTAPLAGLILYAVTFYDRDRSNLSSVRLLPCVPLTIHGQSPPLAPGVGNSLRLTLPFVRRNCYVPIHIGIPVTRDKATINEA